MKITKSIFSLGLLAISLSWSQAQADNLMDIYRLALANDPTLKIDEANFRANAEALAQGRSALLPQINGSAGISNSLTFSQKNKNDNKPGNQVNTRVRDTNYGITLTQSIFNLADWFTFASGKALSKQARADIANSQQDLIIRVATAYFNVLQAKDNLAFAVAQEQATQRQYERAQQQFEVGLIAITGVSQAKAEYDAQVANRIDLENQLADAREALSAITNKQHETLSSLKESFPIISIEGKSQQWVSKALNDNYGVKSAQFALDSSRELARAAKAGHLPTLDANADYMLDNQRSNNPAQRLGPRRGYTLGLTVAVPIFSGGNISSLSRQAQDKMIAAQQTLVKTNRTLIQNTRNFFRAVNKDVLQVQAQKQAIVSSEAALKATEAGYEVGTESAVDVLTTRQNLFQARSNYAAARYSYILDSLRLKQASGQLSPQDLFNINKWLG
jgi:outer membrane protein